MNKNNKKIIVWNVTSKCNLKCEFCFGPENPPSSCGTSADKEGFEIIDKFKKQGAEKLVFTGGEPLTRKDIIDLIQYAKEQGFYTILHTNGLLLTKEKLEMLAKFLDQINLPLDEIADITQISNADKTLMLMRGRAVFEKVQEILMWLRDYSELKIVISTVVTKLNKDCIIKIAKILPEYIYKWRIFQFKAEGRAKMFEKKYKISDDEFVKIKKDIEKIKTNFEVQFVKRNDEFYKTYKEV